MKAILVVDLLGDYNLDELKAYVEVSFKDNNQILCGLFNKELKPLPQKKNNKDIVIKGRTAEILEARYEGWNDCIDEILGEG